MIEAIDTMEVICEKFSRMFEKFGKYGVLKNGDSKGSSIPKGYFPVYVGEDRKRYLVLTAAVNSPAFAAMLDEYEADINHVGPLCLPCSAEAFEHVLRRARDQMKGDTYFWNHSCDVNKLSPFVY